MLQLFCIAFYNLHHHIYLHNNNILFRLFMYANTTNTHANLNINGNPVIQLIKITYLHLKKQLGRII